MAKVGFYRETIFFYSSNVLLFIRRWIDNETGRRSDVPHHFIYNQDHNKNLQVLSGCRVKRVIFE